MYIFLRESADAHRAKLNTPADDNEHSRIIRDADESETLCTAFINYYSKTHFEITTNVSNPD